MQLPSKKRSREDDECDQEVIQIALEIGSTFGKGIDVKLKVWRCRCRPAHAMSL